jgi:hypothetical protein
VVFDLLFLSVGVCPVAQRKLKRTKKEKISNDEKIKKRKRFSKKKKNHQMN